MKTKISNKGRITRVDQAWTSAHREEIERSRITDIDLAHEDALRDQPRTNVVPFIHPGTMERDCEPQEIKASAEPTLPGVAIPLKFISSALLAAASKDIRYYLNGVYVHGVDGEFRICGCDGHRLVVSRFPLPTDQELPEWAEAGIIIPREELAQAMPILSKNAVRYSHDCSEPSVLIDFAIGNPTVTLRAVNGFASFALRPVDGEFPDYAKVLAGNAVTLARGDSEAMQASAINTDYLKGAADIAGKLGAKAVHAFVGSRDGSATYFTFDGAPDTVLIVMPMRTGEAVSDGVVKLIGRSGIEASLAAFRAHVTRTAKALTLTRGSKERSELEDRKAGLESKIAHLLAITTGGLKQLSQKAG